MSKPKGEKIVERLKGFAETLEKSENITARFTCRTIRLNLQPHQYGPDQVKKARSLLGSSQAIFAQFLGVSVRTVHDWEQGRKTPKDVACRLMDEIRRDPGYWLNRMKELSVAANPDEEIVAST
jgi:putative transcriptional regulator